MIVVAVSKRATTRERFLILLRYCLKFMCDKDCLVGKYTEQKIPNLSLNLLSS